MPLLVALGPAVLGARASLNQGLVEVGQFIDRVRTADLFFFRTGKPGKPIFEQYENHLHKRLRMGLLLCHTFLRGCLTEQGRGEGQ
jgi:hypothetical protein